MARRRIVEEPVSHERWLVSYADFITLLFAFFVVMYSISQVNESKYRVLSNTLTDAFHTPETSLDPIQIGEMAKARPINLINLDAMALQDKEGQGAEGTGKEGSGEGIAEQQGGLPSEFREINEEIDQAFGELIKKNLIKTRGNEEWLELELKSSLLFGSGDAVLSVTALELLADIAAILQDRPNPVRVEGFTDDIPISTPRFPSNWELSTARASAVVQLFSEEGISPNRMAAIGYGEHQPITDNTSAEGRASNRRVVLMISKTGKLRPVLNDVTPSSDDPATVTPVNILPGIIVPEGTAQEQARSLVEQLLEPTPAAPVQGEGEQEGNLDGVQTIQLEGGGLLFTSEPEG